jgi:hypothetical protein
MIATLMLGAWQAGWYGGPATPLLIFAFAMVAGGILQSVAAVASFRARDGVAVAVHTAWAASGSWSYWSPRTSCRPSRWAWRARRSRSGSSRSPW